MKKELLIILLIVFYLPKIEAQEINFGLKGGINYNSIGILHHFGNDSGLGTNVTPNEDFDYDADKSISTTFGIFMKINFERLFVQTELNFSTLKNSYPLAFKTSNWESSNVEIPVLFGYKISNYLSTYLGPSYRMINDMTLEGVETPIIYERSSIAANVGLQLELGIFNVDLRYIYILKKEKLQRIDMFRSSYGTNQADLLTYNPSQIVLSISINIFTLNNPDKKNFKWRGKHCLN